MTGAHMGDITITAEPLPPLDELEAIWRRLDSVGAHDFFLTWTWMGTWLGALPPSTQSILIRSQSKDCGLVGLATLTLKRGKLRGLIPIRQAWLNSTGDPRFDCITVEHNGFATTGGNGAALLNELSKSFALGAVPADELVLPGIASVGQPGTGLLEVATRSPGFRAPLQGLGGEQGIDPLLSPNARQQLRRNIRAWQRRGSLSIDIADDSKTALAFFDGLKDLHIRSWNRRSRKHAFSNPFFEAFHRALIVNGIRDRNVDLIRVSAGERVVGYLYNFRRNGTVSCYQSGFEDTVARLRPGYVCHALAMAHYAAAGMSQYDFLAGSNRLKQSLGRERYELVWRKLRRPKLVFRLDSLIRESIKLATRPF